MANAPKTVTLSDGSVWRYGVLEWMQVQSATGKDVHRGRWTIPVRYDDLPLTAADHRAIADVLDPPVRSEAPTQCARCRQWFVPNPTMANASCTVHHSAGSCCHFTEIEVAPPVPSEETPVAWAVMDENDEVPTGDHIWFGVEGKEWASDDALTLNDQAEGHGEKYRAVPLYLHSKPLPQEGPTQDALEAIHQTLNERYPRFARHLPFDQRDALVRDVLALFPKVTGETPEKTL